MTRTREAIKGTPLKKKPAGISRCGMSHASFAQHRFTNEWFELTNQGSFIGLPLDLDFYKHDPQQGPKTRFKIGSRELSKV